jgi:hypothetical protein
MVFSFRLGPVVVEHEVGRRPLTGDLGRCSPVASTGLGSNLARGGLEVLSKH